MIFAGEAKNVFQAIQDNSPPSDWSIQAYIKSMFSFIL